MSHVKNILALLRSGALEQAEKEYLLLGLDRDHSCEDVMALGGRILKARALERSDTEREHLARQSAEKYGAAYVRFGGTFSGINTAAMYLVGGDHQKAQTIAYNLQSTLKTRTPKPGVDAYYHMATVAEAFLICEEFSRARQALEDAQPLDPHNYIAHASTLKQFEMLLTTLGAPTAWLDPFRPPKSLHFAGHLFGIAHGRNSLERPAIYGLEKAVDDILASGDFGAAYGALAAGADIIIAECLLKHGIELHAVQPCPDDLFRAVSIKPFGAGWQARFDSCMAAAKTVRTVSKDHTVCDDLTTAFASETAMGLAVLRANELATAAEQLLIWDGKSTIGTTGTARDAKLWQATGQQQHVVSFPYKRHGPRKDPEDLPVNRSLKAMLFADVKGFGKLSEKQVPLFVSRVLAPLAAHKNEADAMPCHINTWGDGLFLVFDTVGAAAKTAVNLQAAFQTIDLVGIGLPESLALRIGGHYGPVHTLEDPFLNQPGIFGREVTMAARIEPVTVPGSIFVSEPFACALAISKHKGFVCEPLRDPICSKEDGPMTLFSLRTAQTFNSGAQPDHEVE